MTTLSERIDAAEAVVLADLAAAEAAGQGSGRNWTHEWSGSFKRIVGDAWREEGRGNPIAEEVGADDAAHIARQNPAATITRCRQELKRIAADRELLYRIDTTGNEHGHEWLFNAALANLEARYPQGVDA